MVNWRTVVFSADSRDCAVMEWSESSQQVQKEWRHQLCLLSMNSMLLLRKFQHRLVTLRQKTLLVRVPCRFLVNIFVLLNELVYAYLWIIFEWLGAAMVICLEWGANDLHMVQLIPLPAVISCFIKIQIGLTFLMLAYPHCPEKQPLNWCLSVNNFFVMCHSVSAYCCKICAAMCKCAFQLLMFAEDSACFTY